MCPPPNLEEVFCKKPATLPPPKLRPSSDAVWSWVTRVDVTKRVKRAAGRAALQALAGPNEMPPDGARGGSSSSPTRLLICLYLSSFFLFADQNLLAPNLSQIADEFQFSAQE